MRLPIFVYGADVLRQKAVDVDIREEGRDELRALVSDMWETMKNANGVGLAAPQIGKSIRLLVVDGVALEEEMPELEGFKRVMFNPVVIEKDEKIAEYTEGCLSVPDINADIARPASIRIVYFDENFEKKEELLRGFACRMVQHEMDHLDGILFVDRANPIRKKMMQSKLTSILKREIRTSYKIK